MEPFCCKEADIRFSEPRNSIFDQCQNMQLLMPEAFLGIQNTEKRRRSHVQGWTAKRAAWAEKEGPLGWALL